MKFYFRQIGPFKAEAWVEDDSHTVCAARLVLIPGDELGPENILIDQINTHPRYRRKGYARFLVKSLIEKYPECQPTTIDDNETARAFWNSLGLTAALGEEDENA